MNEVTIGRVGLKFRVWRDCDTLQEAQATQAVALAISNEAFKSPAKPLVAFDDPEPGIHPRNHDDATDGLLAGQAT